MRRPSVNLFDQVVTEALKNQPKLASLRAVVEKELLHQDILRVMRDHQLLKNLTFIGGTCLRACYGGLRLSEDLDFTGGKDFSKEQLSTMAKVLAQSLQEKYGLKVGVSSPIKETGNTDTWKVKIETRPGSRDLPTQRINIDVCALPSYEKRPVMLQNPYGIDLGASALILQAQSREEIYADKLIAFALRQRIKHRDLWDISWLHGQKVEPHLSLIPKKLQDRGVPFSTFLTRFNERVASLNKDPRLAVEFNQEMTRFLAQPYAQTAEEQTQFWGFLVGLMEEHGVQLATVAI